MKKGKSKNRVTKCDPPKNFHDLRSTSPGIIFKTHIEIKKCGKNYLTITKPCLEKLSNSTLGNGWRLWSSHISEIHNISERWWSKPVHIRNTIIPKMMLSASKYLVLDRFLSKVLLWFIQFVQRLTSMKRRSYCLAFIGIQCWPNLTSCVKLHI